jgi:hypothetical protein
LSFTADGKAVHPVKMKKEQNKNRYVRLWQHVKSNAQNNHNVYTKHNITAHTSNIYFKKSANNYSTREVCAWVTQQSIWDAIYVQ